MLFLLSSIHFLSDKDNSVLLSLYLKNTKIPTTNNSTKAATIIIIFLVVYTYLRYGDRKQ